MRIGVFSGYISKESHGTYTFQQTVFNAIYNVESNHDFVIFYYGEIPFDKNRKNITLISLNFKNKSFFEKIQYFFKSRIIMDYGNDYFNDLLVSYKIELLWIVTEYVEKKIRIPYVYTILDLHHRVQPCFPEISTAKKGKQWSLREDKYKYFLPRASYIITGTNQGKKEIEKFYGIPEERIRVIPYPTPDFVFIKKEEKASKKFDFLKSKKFLFYPSTIHPHKNHIVVLLALKILKDKFNIDIVSVFTGSETDGNAEFINNKILELNLIDNVYFVGHIEFDELVYLYRNAFALVYPSFIGPDNLPPLEAFGLGCPAICASIPGSDEQLGDNALLFDPTKEDDLVSKIVQLYNNDDLRKKMIKKGYLRASIWVGNNYLDEILKIINDFEPLRRTWGHGSYR